MQAAVSFLSKKAKSRAKPGKSRGGSSSHAALLRAQPDEADLSTRLPGPSNPPKKKKGKDRKAPEDVVDPPEADNPEIRREEQLVKEYENWVMAEWRLAVGATSFDGTIKDSFGVSDDYKFSVALDSKNKADVAAFQCGRTADAGIYLHFDNFCAGFRPPFDPFFVDVMHALEAMPSDFHPSATRALSSFAVACRLNQIEPTAVLFKEFYNFVYPVSTIIGVRAILPRIFTSPSQKAKNWGSRVMRVESAVGWPFPNFGPRSKKRGANLPSSILNAAADPAQKDALLALAGVVGDRDPQKYISWRALLEFSSDYPTWGGLPGHRHVQPLIDIPPPTIYDSDEHWWAGCHLGRCVPSLCETCGGDLTKRTGKFV